MEISDETRTFFYTASFPESHLRLLDVYGQALTIFRSNVSQNFTKELCDLFMQSKLWLVMQEYETCVLEASVLLDMEEREIALIKASHNIYHIWRLFGQELGNTMDISSALFSDVTNVIFYEDKEDASHILEEEMREVSGQLKRIYLFLGSIIYKLVHNGAIL